LDNDGKCAAMAELWKGSLQGIDHGVVLTLGTGIGGGIIANGKLLRGYNFAAGELSLLPTTILDGQEMNFWANINATSGLTRPYEARKGLTPKSISGKAFFEALSQNDKDAQEVLEIFGRNFANGLFAIQAVLDTQRVAIGGGISAQDVLIDTIRAKVDDFFSQHQGIPQQKMEIVRCAFGNDSNLIGALYHHLYE
jgi:predicted NBD/HSP70 family sugar kinase